jgi:hypothetical protein
MFAGSPGTTLTIHGETYDWTSATEVGTWHSDTYTNTTTTSQTVTVTGMIGFPDLATVSGSSSTGTVDGHLSAGVYGDSQTTFTGDDSWQINGVTYTHRNRQDNYTVDLTYGYLLTSGFDDYSGLDGNLHTWWSEYAGEGIETHSIFTGGKTPFSGQLAFTVFGTLYNFSESSSYTNHYYDGQDGGWTDKYESTTDEGILEVTASNSSSYWLQIWDPDLGSVTSNTVTTVPDNSLTGITWHVRSAPTFAKPQLWLDGKLLNWQSGTITTAGMVTDTYSGAGVTLTVSALAYDYFTGGGNAAVSITSTGGGTGDGTGTLGHDGTFNLSGHVMANASLNHSAPLFTGTATVLRVSGTSYAFTGGFQDSLGNRTDVYVNPSSGTLTISGATTDPYHGTVKLCSEGSNISGTYSNGVFTMSYGIPVAKQSSQPSIYGPPAFWVRGEFYLRNEDTLTNYTSTPNAEHSLTLTGSSTWTLAGTDGTGAFSGACSKDPVGVFLVQALDESSQPIPGAFVPVIPANADGSLHLSWEPAPTGMPPAVRVNDRHLVYLGTSTDDTNSAATAAYYGSAMASDQSDWLVKLRTDGTSTTPYTVTYTDYSTATSTTGSYSEQTHLFQTSAPAVPPAVGFPVPVYGVDPNANFALWGLTQPEGGLPPTFMVRGQPWRLAAYNTATDTATYQGFYNGQEMALGAAADASGERRVTLTDPIHNRGSQVATQGSLNSERRSALLRDGTLVLSGTDDGQQAVVEHTDDYKLQTIAADLDIVGNNLSFGILNGDASRAGALFNFGDDSSTASLHSILSRPLAQWVWARTTSSSGQSTLPVMKLDATHKLTLYDSPATGQAQNAGVVLDPKVDGVSTIRGVLRVRPGGDIDMGGFMAGGQP